MLISWQYFNESHGNIFGNDLKKRYNENDASTLSADSYLANNTKMFKDVCTQV